MAKNEGIAAAFSGFAQGVAQGLQARQQRLMQEKQMAQQQQNFQDQMDLRRQELKIKQAAGSEKSIASQALDLVRSSKAETNQLKGLEIIGKQIEAQNGSLTATNTQISSLQEEIASLRDSDDPVDKETAQIKQGELQDLLQQRDITFKTLRNLTEAFQGQFQKVDKIKEIKNIESQPLQEEQKDELQTYQEESKGLFRLKSGKKYLADDTELNILNRLGDDDLTVDDLNQLSEIVEGARNPELEEVFIQKATEAMNRLRGKEQASRIEAQMRKREEAQKIRVKQKMTEFENRKRLEKMGTSGGGVF